MDSIRINQTNMKMIAHRGFSSAEVENTYAAFLAAANRTYYGIECDLRKTADKRFVTFHDDGLKRLAGIDRSVRSMTVEELGGYALTHPDNPSVRFKGATLFEDYLELCRKYNKVAVIELKDRFLKRDIQKIMKTINEHQMSPFVKIISFHLFQLKIIREFNLEIALQYLVEKYTDKVLLDCQKYHMDMSIYYPNLNKDIVEMFHSYKIKVAVWTVDNPVDALMLSDWGVDYLTSNILE